ncbi:hypothetical protein RchiOBHm_Chr2g0169481 [Rosa chinensis]|uniref:Uncharacterized protein n=1 Tax=Rosa chinensis TaxID=74649 RepID=A0A2P6S4U0_ROSCH|nr:hypothetical protein RchiOBHm_Chr2g0169481 [Rosa chinensis]
MRIISSSVSQSPSLGSAMATAALLRSLRRHDLASTPLCAY